MFKDQKGPFSEKEFLVLDSLFGDVDAYCPNPELRDGYDLNEHQLLHKSEIALHKLSSLLNG